MESDINYNMKIIRLEKAKVAYKMMIYSYNLEWLTNKFDQGGALK